MVILHFCGNEIRKFVIVGVKRHILNVDEVFKMEGEYACIDYV